jgi:hypothetical protein
MLYDDFQKQHFVSIKSVGTEPEIKLIDMSFFRMYFEKFCKLSITFVLDFSEHFGQTITNEVMEPIV